MEDKLIKCVSNVGQEPYEVKLSDLVNEIGVTWDKFQSGTATQEESFTINGIPCKIYFNLGHYCGYVHPEDVYPDLPPDLEDIINVQPHGGYTAAWGFDCAHYQDIRLIDIVYGINPIPGATFKNQDYVYHQLMNLTQEIKIYMDDPDGYPIIDSEDDDLESDY